MDDDKNHIGYTEDGKEIILADCVKVDEYMEEVTLVLQAIAIIEDHPSFASALVTDESRVTDFIYDMEDYDKPYRTKHGGLCTGKVVLVAEDDERLRKMAEWLGVEYVKPDEYIWEVARRVREIKQCG